MTLSHSNTVTNSIHRVDAEGLPILQAGAEALGIDLTDNMQRQLLEHIELLARWNRRLNLTAITSPRQMVIQHILDSMAIASILTGRTILDLGSGGGYPGIPLAVIFPQRQFTLLDSRGKRIEFLRHVVGKIGLSNTSTVKTRVEDYQPKQKFDTLVCRAFSSLQDMLRRTQGLQHPTSRLLAMKGKYPVEEISILPDSLQRRLKVESIEVPFLDAKRHLVVIQF
jgi:16S rRNA (guanine527-N7)-methyltransferase